LRLRSDFLEKISLLEVTHRPDRHVTAERAKGSVGKIIADAGFAFEVIENDYGEDLLIQTSHGGVMDASRMWLQLKGTKTIGRYRRGDGALVYPVSMTHALRWARSADPVIVVLWDVEKEAGRFAEAPGNVKVWGGIDEGRKTVSLVFPPDQVFDVEAVQRLAWDSRMQRFRDLLAQHKVFEEEHAEDGDGDESSGGLTTILALQALQTLGLVEYKANGIWAITTAAIEQMTSELKLIFETTEVTEGNWKELAADATVLTLIHWHERVTGAGIYGTILRMGGEVLFALLQLPEQLAMDEDKGSRASN
jgi:Domain of unknown function (DUF4365)